ADRRRLGTIRVSQPRDVLAGYARERTRSDGSRNVEVARVRAVGHRRPVGAALTRGLDQDRFFPERLEDAAGLLIALHRLGTLRHCGVPDGVRLRLGRSLSWLLWHPALLDAYQRL